MSASRLNTRNTILIGVVVVMGIAVTILNIQTFGKGSLPSRRVQAGHQDGPALPGDLSTLVRDTDNAMALAGDGIAAASGDRPTLERDPFLGRIKPVAARVKAAPRRKVTLVCSAVVLGGSGPVAMINGERLAVGDQIQGMTVTSVDTRGVRLRSSSGKNVVLAVGSTNSGTGSMTMEFKKKPSDITTGTKVSERNLP